MTTSGTSARIARSVLACVAAGALLASCGSDDDAASIATAPATGATSAVETTASAAGSTASESSTAVSGDVCADREALRSSVADLTDVDLVAEGTNGVEPAVEAVKEDLAALRSSAESELEPEVQAVEDAVDELETAVADLGSGGAAEAATAVSDLAEAASTLLDELDQGSCG